MKVKLSRVIVAVVIASSLILGGTAHAGWTQPGGKSITLGAGQ